MAEDECEVPQVARVTGSAGLAAALRALGFSRGRPVVVLVGGAAGMQENEVSALAAVLSAAVLPALGDDGALIDGGTDAGVMRAAGRARADGGFLCRLVGVAAEGTVSVPDGSSNALDAPLLEPRHTDVLLVPGSSWGDESAWIGRVARAIANGFPSVTVLANGGAIAGRDVEQSLASGRPVIVLAGTGRLSDLIATETGDGQDSSISRIAASDLTAIVDVHDLEAVRTAVIAALQQPSANSPEAGDLASGTGPSRDSPVQS